MSIEVTVDGVKLTEDQVDTATAKLAAARLARAELAEIPHGTRVVHKGFNSSPLRGTVIRGKVQERYRAAICSEVDKYTVATLTSGWPYATAERLLQAWSIVPGDTGWE